MLIYFVLAKTPKDHRCILSNYSAGDVDTICTGLDCIKLIEALRVEFAEECVQFELSDNPGRLGYTTHFGFLFLHKLLIGNFFYDSSEKSAIY